MTASPAMSLAADSLAARCGGDWVGNAAGVNATSIEIDSRQCGAGSLFVALAGESVDGHDYIEAAAEKGAVAAIVTRDVAGAPVPCLRVKNMQQALNDLGSGGRAAHAAKGGKLVGITGSVGKTGSKEMLAHLLRAAGTCHASRASFNNHLGVPLTLAALPEAPVPAVQEIGMNAPGEITALTRLARPDIAIITRIADSHAGFFDSLDAIAAAKAEIFDGLAANGTAILNRDDSFFDMLASRATTKGAGRIISFGTDAGADFRLVTTTRADNGMVVEALIEGVPVSFRLGMRGAHWAMNAMAVLAAMAALQEDVTRVAENLQYFNDLPGRGTVSNGFFADAEITLVDDSYNAGPASMKAAFASLAATPPQVMVLSDMLELGEGTAAAHAALAPAIIALRPRLLVTIGPEMSRMAAALPSATRHSAAETAEEATEVLRRHVRSGDTVFVKGSNGSGAWRVAAALTDAMRAALTDRASGPRPPVSREIIDAA